MASGKRRQDQEPSTSKQPRWDDSVFGLAQQPSTSRVHDLRPEPRRDRTEPRHDEENFDDSNETLPRRPRRSFFREEKFTEACHPRWPTLQCVATAGTNPLPAMVKNKRCADERWYTVEEEKDWEMFEPAVHVYREPIQIMMRKAIGRSIVRAFGLFEYKLDDLILRYYPRLPTKHDLCLERVGAMVIEEYTRVVDAQKEIWEKSSGETMQREKELYDQIRHVTDHLCSAFNIAKLILDLLLTTRVMKNWNSHGAALGSSLCQLSSILACLPLPQMSRSPFFREIIPQGRILTGSKHGHSETVYVEYMVAGRKVTPTLPGRQSYLEPELFLTLGHGPKVSEKFNEKRIGTVEKSLQEPRAEVLYPVSRPTRGHTLDFSLSYAGVRLIDGECKHICQVADAAVLVLHSVDQLAFKDTAHAMLTDSSTVRFYVSEMGQSNRIETKYWKSPSYKLEPLLEATLVDDPQASAACVLIPHEYREQMKGGSIIVRGEDCQQVLDVWRALHSQMRKFINVTLKTLDQVTAMVASMNLTTIKQRAEDSDRSFPEPYFRLSNEQAVKNGRPVADPHKYVYDREAMAEGTVPIQRDEDGQVDEQQVLAERQESLAEAESSIGELCREYGRDVIMGMVYESGK